MLNRFIIKAGSISGIKYLTDNGCCLLRRYRLMLFLLLGMTLFAVPTAKGGSNRIRFTKAYGRHYVYLRDIARYYDMHCYVWKKKSVVWNKRHRLTFYYNKKHANIDGVKINLMYAPFRRGIQAFVSEKDFLLMIDPLIRPYALDKRQVKLIMLDPGHGGKDNGGAGNGILEKNLTLQLAKKLQQRLRHDGYKVIMTRNRDRYVSLQQRTALCKNLSPDLFVSIHANIAAKKSVSGIETFCISPVGTASTNSKTPSFKLERGNRFDKNSANLAYQVQKRLKYYCRATDRGVKHARFYVLKNASCPAILIEVGFLSNRAEAKKLLTDNYQARLVKAIENGIISHHYRLRSLK